MCFRTSYKLVLFTVVIASSMIVGNGKGAEEKKCWEFFDFQTCEEAFPSEDRFVGWCSYECTASERPDGSVMHVCGDPGIKSWAEGEGNEYKVGRQLRETTPGPDTYQPASGNNLSDFPCSQLETCMCEEFDNGITSVFTNSTNIYPVWRCTRTGEQHDDDIIFYPETGPLCVIPTDDDDDDDDDDGDDDGDGDDDDDDDDDDWIDPCDPPVCPCDPGSRE